MFLGGYIHLSSLGELDSRIHKNCLNATHTIFQMMIVSNSLYQEILVWKDFMNAKLYMRMAAEPESRSFLDILGMHEQGLGQNCSS